MALHDRDPPRLVVVPQDTRIILNQPTSTADSPSDEAMGEADEPPDDNQLVSMKQACTISPEFRKISCPMQRKHSLLTRTLQTSESDSQHEEEYNVFSGPNRANSSASTWSRGSAASTAELTSDGHTSRTGTPSPPLPPARFHGILPIFSNLKPFDAASAIKTVHDTAIDPLRTITPISENEKAVEAGLGRKRCIMFACGRKESSKQEAPVKDENVKPADKPAELPKRPSALKFVCPMRAQISPTANKPHIRLMSPPPNARRPQQSPKASGRSHRGSDSTVRNDSPKSVRKVPSVVQARRASVESDVGHSEATRFHEFATSESEIDDWTQEATCHRSRLTIEDTLKVENKLRKLGKEVEDEVMEEDEEEELEDEADEDEDLDDEDDEDDNDSIGIVDSTGYVSDEGFQTDDEGGFAGSDDESDADSDDAWWAPSAATGEQLEHIRPTSRRSDSGSSIGSFSSTRVFPSKTPKMIKRKRSLPIAMRPRTPELPDSTDFVCGTLDEDRPLEQAYISCLEQRRAAKHKPVPQDIDPTFPTSDPEMEEEDEDSEEEAIHVDESDHHMFFHGHPDASDSSVRESRGIVPKKRSPPHSPPKRMRSPPPTKRMMHRSPPPSRLFGQSPKRLRSPPPARPPYSPPPSRRTSFVKARIDDINATPVALAERPRLCFRGTSSLPRNGAYALHRPSMHDDDNDSNENDDGQQADTSTDNLPSRGAIDIVKGLEKKRQRRREKMYEKYCRLRSRGKDRKHQHVTLPGKGAERMKEMGMELAALRGRKPANPMEQGQHILSY